MGTKEDRQAAMRRIIGSQRVTTQGQLLRALRKRRLTVDQSTLSRDLAELGIRKRGGRYVLDDHRPTSNDRVDYSGAVRRFVTCGPHLIVISTATGQAQPVALTIDDTADPAITATLAGDDTIFVVTRNRRAQVVALRRLEQWFGDKHEQ